MFLFTGCDDMVEIEDRDFIQTLGVSVEGDELKVSFVLPDISALTGQQAKEGDKLYVGFKGKNFSDIEEQYSYNSDKKLDYNHLKAIIFEYSAVKNPKYMKNILQFIEENYDIARNTKTFITTNKLEDVLKLDETMSGSVGDYLENYYKNNRSKQLNEECTIGDLINAMNNKDQVVHVPVLAIQNNRFRIDGIGLFEGDKAECRSYLTEDESKYLFLADDEVNEISLALSDGYAVRISDMKTKYTYSLKENIPYVYLEIEGDAKLIDYDAKVTNQSNSSKNIDKSLIEQQVNSQIKSTITNFYNLYVKNKSIDILNLYRRSGLKSRKIWMQYKNNVDGFLKDVELGLVVKLDLDHNFLE
jgi:Ger(x)C family germination protein